MSAISIYSHKSNTKLTTVQAIRDIHHAPENTKGNSCTKSER